MPLTYDSVLVGALARTLEERWTGRPLESMRFDPATRRVTLAFRDETWAWLLHPTEGGALLRVEEAARRRRERGLLEGRRLVAGVAASADTRAILVTLEGGSDAEAIAFELVTNRWNALHLVDGRVASLLVAGVGRDPVRRGDHWAPPRSDRRWATTAPSAEEWDTLVAGRSTPDADDPPRWRDIAWISAINEDFVFADLRRSLERWKLLRRAGLGGSEAAWLVPGPRRAHHPIPYPSPLDAQSAARHDDLLAAFAAWARETDESPAIDTALRTVAEPEEITALRAALRDRRERAAKKIRALESEVVDATDPEELRMAGHLLLARKSAVRSGAASVELEDFEGGTRVIELDPTLDAVGNADAYYDRAKRLERAAAGLPDRIARERRRVEAIDAATARLDSAPTGTRIDISDATWKLAGGRRRVLASIGGARSRSGRRGAGKPGPRDADAARLPYRVYRTSSGREIRAGRSARANDELTFRHSAPDDIWMHVRESPGSHVVLRWGDRDQNPPESEIVEAALVAAELSRARGAGVVPVAWTRRKYVRKPRKAPPGTVVTERTQTVFVEPDPARVSRMADED